MNNPRRAKGCFPRHHQTPGENALYQYMYAASKKSGVFYSNDREPQFESQKTGGKVSKNTITAWRHNLEKKGWIERIDQGPRQRNPVTGLYLSIRYRVLDHAQWAAKFPERCTQQASPVTSEEPPHSVEHNEGHQSQSLGQAPVPVQSQSTTTTCPNQRVPPVPTIGTKIVKKERKESECNQSEKAGQDSDSNNPSHISFSNTFDRNVKELADVVVLTALKAGASAFTEKAKTKIERIIQDVQPTEKDVVLATELLMSTMDKYAKQTADDRIAASLKAPLGRVKAKREAEELAKRAAEKEALPDENVSVPF